MRAQTNTLSLALLARPMARRGGFSAIEVTAVAAIIAVMALILIPIVRNRVEEARKVAAQDDMAGIEKAESLAYGFTNYYFRLQDLNRPESATIPGANATQIALEAAKPPKAAWNKPFNAAQQAQINSTWKGSFVAYHHTQNVFTLEGLYPQLFRREAGGSGSGPILITGDDAANFTNSNYFGQQYPIDPWGSPYIFFGAGFMGDAGNPAITYNPTNPVTPNQMKWDTSVVYSLGPDGEPSSNGVNGYNSGTHYAQPASYFRETGFLGSVNSDDLKREF
jgi:Tfp pilus assembly protein PilE